jgi:hypothetical protein
MHIIWFSIVYPVHDLWFTCSLVEYTYSNAVCCSIEINCYKVRSLYCHIYILYSFTYSMSWTWHGILGVVMTVLVLYFVNLHLPKFADPSHITDKLYSMEFTSTYVGLKLTTLQVIDTHNLGRCKFTKYNTSTVMTTP